FFYFLFSSRGRHTRFSRDWSSDVCSSDLVDPVPELDPTYAELFHQLFRLLDFNRLSAFSKVFGFCFSLPLLVLGSALCFRLCLTSEERSVGKECITPCFASP